MALQLLHDDLLRSTPRVSIDFLNELFPALLLATFDRLGKLASGFFVDLLQRGVVWLARIPFSFPSLAYALPTKSSYRIIPPMHIQMPVSIALSGHSGVTGFGDSPHDFFHFLSGIFGINQPFSSATPKSSRSNALAFHPSALVLNAYLTLFALSVDTFQKISRWSLRCKVPPMRCYLRRSKN